MSTDADDLKLPTAVIQRLIKSELPEKTIVSREAKTAIARAAAVFILHTTSFANEAATSANRKTITAQDILHGLSDLDCDELINPVRESLQSWREEQKAKKAAKKPRLSESTAADSAKETDDNETETANGEVDNEQSTTNENARPEAVNSPGRDEASGDDDAESD